MSMNPITSRAFELYKEKAYSTGYHQKKCEEIKARVSQIKLPTISDTKIKYYRRILEQSNKKFEISKKELSDKFLDIMEMIYFLNSITDDKELHPYMEYIIQYEYVIKRILENKKARIAQHTINQSIIILRPEIEKFIAKFARIAEGDVDSRSREDTEDILHGGKDATPQE